MNCIRRSSGAPAEIAASGFTRVHEGSQCTINIIFTGEHLNLTLKNIRISGKLIITRVHYAFERCLPKYERGFTRVYTRVYVNPDVSFTIHPDFNPGFCSRRILQSERAPFVPLNKA